MITRDNEVFVYFSLAKISLIYVWKRFLLHVYTMTPLKRPVASVAYLLNFSQASFCFRNDMLIIKNWHLAVAKDTE